MSIAVGLIGFDFKPQAERPQQQWIVDQDIIPMLN
jgi:hypothetical protein